MAAAKSNAEENAIFLSEIVKESGHAESSTSLDENSLSKHMLNMHLPDDSTDETGYNTSRKSKVWKEPTYSQPYQKPDWANQEPELDASEDKDSKEPLKVLVERGIQFHGHPKMIYPMIHNPRGIALIINNDTFTIPEMYAYRKGADVDSTNLQNLFTQLGLQVFSYKNLTRSQTLKKLIDISEFEGHNSADMAAICIMSHGTEHGKVVSADCLDMDTEVDIFRRFNNENCPELKGKPKFFIIQACRGEDFDNGVQPKYQIGDVTDAVASKTRKMSSTIPPGGRAKDLSWEDMLIAFATLPGYVSNRDHFRGTWFIESLCQVFMTHAKDTHLRDMLDLVGLQLKEYQSEWGTKQSFSYDVRHFYKKLYFNPGINIDPREEWKYFSRQLSDKKRTMSETVFPNSSDDVVDASNCMEPSDLVKMDSGHPSVSFY